MTVFNSSQLSTLIHDQTTESFKYEPCPNLRFLSLVCWGMSRTENWWDTAPAVSQPPSCRLPMAAFHVGLWAVVIVLQSLRYVKWSFEFGWLSMCEVLLTTTANFNSCKSRRKWFPNFLHQQKSKWCSKVALLFAVLCRCPLLFSVVLRSFGIDEWRGNGF